MPLGDVRVLAALGRWASRWLQWCLIWGSAGEGMCNRRHSEPRPVKSPGEHTGISNTTWQRKTRPAGPKGMARPTFLKWPCWAWGLAQAPLETQRQEEARRQPTKWSLFPVSSVSTLGPDLSERAGDFEASVGGGMGSWGREVIPEQVFLFAFLTPSLTSGPACHPHHHSAKWVCGVRPHRWVPRPGYGRDQGGRVSLRKPTCLSYFPPQPWNCVP